MALLLAAMPFHAFFGITLMSTNSLIGAEFYRSLALPWLPDLLADQRAGGGIAWATGEIPVLFVVVVLLMQWSKEDDAAPRATTGEPRGTTTPNCGPTTTCSSSCPAAAADGPGRRRRQLIVR